MKLVNISCTHKQHSCLELPKGDLLIHCGDSDIRNKKDLRDLNDWFGAQDFKYKIYVAGNHDIYLIKKTKLQIQELLSNATYLENDLIDIKGIKIYGSPYIPRFGNWAFMRSRGEEIRKYWKLIPSDTNILITHGPAYGILDKVVFSYTNPHVGCEELKEEVLGRIKPKYHIFGHIHESYGVKVIEETTFINCCVLNEDYKLTNKPIIIDY